MTSEAIQRRWTRRLCHRLKWSMHESTLHKEAWIR
jgi:hypothetical protein